MDLFNAEVVLKGMVKLLNALNTELSKEAKDALIIEINKRRNKDLVDLIIILNDNNNYKSNQDEFNICSSIEKIKNLGHLLANSNSDILLQEKGSYNQIVEDKIIDEIDLELYFQKEVLKKQKILK